MKRLNQHHLPSRLCAAVILLALTVPVAADDQACGESIAKHLFADLEKIDSEGEQQLNQALKRLAEKEGWSQAEWEDYALSLADNAAGEAREQQRDDLVADIFALLSQPPFECDQLAGLHEKVLQIEQTQWGDALKRIEQRMHGHDSGY